MDRREENKLDRWLPFAILFLGQLGTFIVGVSVLQNDVKYINKRIDKNEVVIDKNRDTLYRIASIVDKK